MIKAIVLALVITLAATAPSQDRMDKVPVIRSINPGLSRRFLTKVICLRRLSPYRPRSQGILLRICRICSGQKQQRPSYFVA